MPKAFGCPPWSKSFVGNVSMESIVWREKAPFDKCVCVCVCVCMCVCVHSVIDFVPQIVRFCLRLIIYSKKRTCVCESIVWREIAPFDKCVWVGTVSPQRYWFCCPNSPPLFTVNHLLWKGYIHVSMKSILGRKKAPFDKSVWVGTVSPHRYRFCSPNSPPLFTVNHLL